MVDVGDAHVETTEEASPVTKLPIWTLINKVLVPEGLFARSISIPRSHAAKKTHHDSSLSDVESQLLAFASSELRELDPRDLRSNGGGHVVDDGVCPGRSKGWGP